MLSKSHPLFPNTLFDLQNARSVIWLYQKTIGSVFSLVHFLCISVEPLTSDLNWLLL